MVKLVASQRDTSDPQPALTQKLRFLQLIRSQRWASGH